MLTRPGLLIRMLARTGFNSSRFALATVLLLAARGNLRQSKTARVLRTFNDALQVCGYQPESGH